MVMTATAINAARALPPGAVRAAVGRIDSLDFTKGVLVLWMLLYHWLNYFVAIDGWFYRYLRPVTPSFILVAGFIVTHVYLRKYEPTDRRLHRRLYERGAKLLVLFTVLNLISSAVITTNYNGMELGVGAFLRDAPAIYVWGGGRAVFDVLVPIGYFLLLAPVVLATSARFRAPLYVPAGILVLLVAGLGFAGMRAGHLELLSMAFLGMAAGTVPLQRIERVVRHTLPLIVANAVYLVAVAVWDVVFLLQVVGVALSLMVIHLVGMRVSARARVPREINELGKYSLLSYIAQVALLQVLRRAAPQSPGLMFLLMLLVATVALTWAAIRLTSYLRLYSKILDRGYRFVFA
jgi:peptidoglycan/LPS O-acetylase OafA/YrhL